MSTTETKSRNRFFSGVVALTLANVFVKIVGLILKIPLREILTDEGMVYYNNAYDIYAFLFTIATTGLPTAVAMLISENRVRGNRREIKKIFRVTLLLFLVIGLLGMSVMLFGAPLFEKAYQISGSTYCIMAVAPTLLFICLASALRGYFQGYQYMTPTAVSEVIEAIGKLVLGLLFAGYAADQGMSRPVIAAYAALGLTIGVAAGMVFLMVRKLLFRPQSFDEYASVEESGAATRTVGGIVKTLFMIAVPITLSNSVMSFSAMLDGMILSRRLQGIGYSEEIVKTMIGNYKSCATPICNLPLAMVGPITASIIPLMAATIAGGNRARTKKVMDSSFLLTAIMELPCALGVSILSVPIIQLLFGTETSAEQAAPLLSVLALSIFFHSMISITAAILQAHKLERKPILSMIVGAVVKLLGSYLLVGIPAVNIYGSPLSSLLCSFSISATNLYFIKKHIGYVPHFKKILLRPFAASVVCALTAMGAYRLIDLVLPGSRLTVLLAIAVAAVVYFFVLFLFRALSEEDILLLPKGEKLCTLLKKVHLLKA